MQHNTLPPLLRQMIASRPDVQVKKTITVDPLVMDGLELERSLLQTTLLMESREWSSEEEAKAFSQNLMPFWATTDKSASEAAEELIIKARAATNKITRLSIASEALRIFPQCAHAYLLLAMEETDLPQKIALLEEGIAAAEATLKPEIFKEYADCVWERVETRP
jgi:hypothetical protein